MGAAEASALGLPEASLSRPSLSEPGWLAESLSHDLDPDLDQALRFVHPLSAVTVEISPVFCAQIAKDDCRRPDLSCLQIAGLEP